MKNYYKILGLNFNATQKEISHAYKILARRYHPDINKEENATKKFEEITESYQTLKNPLSRKEYDIKFKNYIIKSYQANFYYNVNNKKYYTNTTNNYYKTTTVKATFNKNNNNYSSNKKETTIHKHSILKNFSKIIKCIFKPIKKGFRLTLNLFCKCFKRKEKTIQFFNLELTPIEAILGTQKFIKIRKTDFKIIIPPGSYNGKVLTFQYKDEKTPIIVYVNVIENDFISFEKKGIIINIPISFKEAVLGGKIKVPTPKGLFYVPINPGTSSQTLIKMKSFNMILPNKETIDLYFRVLIKPPKKFNNEKFQNAINEIDKYFNYKERDNSLKNIYNVA